MAPLFVLDPNSPLSRDPGHIPPAQSAPKSKPEKPKPVLGKPSVYPTFDVLYYLATQHLHAPESAQALSTLSMTNNMWHKICRRILFGEVTFNLRRRDIGDRILGFWERLHTNPGLARDVRSLAIRDHTLTSEMQNSEAILPFREPQDSHTYFPHKLMQSGKIHALITDGTTLAQVIGKLSKLTSVEMSLFYKQISFSRMSPSFQSALCDVIAYRGDLTFLSLQGIAKLPQCVLERFSRLNTLKLSNCSIDSSATQNLPIANRKRPTFIGQYGNSLQLSSITIRNVHAMDPLFKFWKNDSTAVGHVDMAHPTSVHINFTDKYYTYRELLAGAAENVQHLRLHTLALGVACSLVTDIVARRQLDRDTVDDPRIWFEPSMLLQPDDLKPLVNLQTLEISISYWDTIYPDGQPGPNKEFEWALRLFQCIPTDRMREVVLRVKVGGYPKDDRRIMSAFSYHNVMCALWDRWIHELSGQRWKDLQIFTFQILAGRAYPAERIMNMKAARRALSSAFEHGKCQFHVKYAQFTDDGLFHHHC